jgi:hypothetical protein
VLQEEGTVAPHVPAYVHLLHEAATRRELLALGGRLIDGACNGQPVAELLDALQRFAPPEAAPADAYLEPLAAFLADEDPPHRVIFPDLLPAGVIMLLHGEPRSRKSLAAFELALAAATGTAPFGLARFWPATGPVAVLHIQEEDPRALTRARLRRLVAERCGDALPATLHVAVRRGVNLDDPAWVTRLGADLTRLNVKLLVLDAARRFSVKTDEGPTKVREFTAVVPRESAARPIRGSPRTSGG